MNDYRLLEHTADMGIEARGATLEELLLAAAAGLREIIVVPERPLTRSLQVTISGANPEELLVNWLSEILVSLELERLAPQDFLIDALDDGRLTATISGWDADDYLEREVKAITWHQLIVREDADGWFCQVYVDL